MQKGAEKPRSWEIKCPCLNRQRLFEGFVLVLCNAQAHVPSEQDVEGALVGLLLQHKNQARENWASIHGVGFFPSVYQTFGPASLPNLHFFVCCPLLNMLGFASSVTLSAVLNRADEGWFAGQAFCRMPWGTRGGHSLSFVGPRRPLC